MGPVSLVVSLSRTKRNTQLSRSSMHSSFKKIILAGPSITDDYETTETLTVIEMRNPILS